MVAEASGMFRLNLIDFHRGIRDFREELPQVGEGRRLMGRLFGLRLRDRSEAMSLLRDQIEESADNDGVRFGSFQEFFQWIIEHQEEILKFVMAIIAMFSV